MKVSHSIPWKSNAFQIWDLFFLLGPEFLFSVALAVLSELEGTAVLSETTDEFRKIDVNQTTRQDNHNSETHRQREIG